MFELNPSRLSGPEEQDSPSTNKVTILHAGKNNESVLKDMVTNIYWFQSHCISRVFTFTTKKM